MKTEVNFKGQKYSMEWLNRTDFESFEKVKNVFGFIFDSEGNVCVVRSPKKNYWSLPGGGLELEESFEDALIREVDEEADIDIKKIKRLGCFKVSPLTDNCENEIHYTVRFVALVDKLKKQTIDPADGVLYERKFISVNEFSEYIKWGHEGEFQLRKALEVLNNS